MICTIKYYTQLKSYLVSLLHDTLSDLQRDQKLSSRIFEGACFLAIHDRSTLIRVFIDTTPQEGRKNAPLYQKNLARYH